MTAGERVSLTNFSRASGVPVDRLKYYNQNNILPSGSDLEAICKAAQTSEFLLKLKMGRIDSTAVESLRCHADEIARLVSRQDSPQKPGNTQSVLKFEIGLGKLYQGDCLVLLRAMESESVDLVFADPPFNLSKLYPSDIDDNLKAERYVSWCQEWLYECIRVLKPGGSLFLWNLPKWNVVLA